MENTMRQVTELETSNVLPLKTLEDDPSNAALLATLSAIDRSQAVIEFEMDGTIITANDNFLGAMGYTLDEIKGQHHRLFVEDPGSPEYKQFWESLKRGEFESKEFKRIGKGGKEIWIQASYNPILDMNGAPFISGQIRH